LIYVLGILDQKFAKIGFTTDDDVRGRVAALQTGCPFKLEPIVTAPSTLLQEQALHAALIIGFGRCRIPMPPGEWYPGRHNFFRTVLDRLRQGGVNDAILFAELYNPAVKQPGRSATKANKHNSGCRPTCRWPIRDYTVKIERQYRQRGPRASA
jgi:hypothetical protein